MYKVVVGRKVACKNAARTHNSLLDRLALLKKKAEQGKTASAAELHLGEEGAVALCLKVLWLAQQRNPGRFAFNWQIDGTTTFLATKPLENDFKAIFTMVDKATGKHQEAWNYTTFFR